MEDIARLYSQLLPTNYLPSKRLICDDVDEFDAVVVYLHEAFLVDGVLASDEKLVS